MGHRICPRWLGYLLTSPVRRLLQDRDEILRSRVKAGMSVLDISCGMGFISSPLAKPVGEKGRVVCVDLQGKMIKGLVASVRKSGFYDGIEARVCDQRSLGLGGLVIRRSHAVVLCARHGSAI